ncbi:methyl-viologen-reducing hydrogenase subunit delta [candidate division KSB1 bacterium]|nr:MAG: methyl-viologen-reducing hydrogenase subunit delta [candidate division KSB1 bacterium]
MNDSFKPKIIYFLCSWCGTGGSETASAFGLHYPENVLPFRVNCTGSLSTVYILRAFLEGADGVVISGCHPGDCHYNNGNFRARRRVAIIKSILDTLGLEPERIWFRYVAHGEGKRFVDTAAEFNDYIKKLGPNPLKTRRDI